MTNAKTAAMAQTKALMVTEAAAPAGGGLALSFGTPSVGRIESVTSCSLVVCGEDGLE